MDFFQIRVKEGRGDKKGTFEVFADFTVGGSKDLMVKGGVFHAIWDEERGFWSKNDLDVARLVDQEVRKHADKIIAEGKICEVKSLRSFDSNRWVQFQKFARSMSDNHHQLDAKLTFANTDVKKTDYATRRLSYPLIRGPHPAYDELVGHLYDDEEREKFEWAIGAVISGDSRKIEKFLVFKGAPGTGKSTVMNLIADLFDGYWEAFDASALVNGNNQFGLEAFRDNPIVAIQHDGDLSKIEDNTRLNSLVSHEPIRINEKFKPTYRSRIDSFLFMGTNDPVRITNADSGLVRRLIDVYPSERTHDIERYSELIQQVRFELGPIAHHCLDVYKALGKHYYKTYKPTRMISQTNIIFNFIQSVEDVFIEQDSTNLKSAYALYKEYCAEASLEFRMPMHRFREELKKYFRKFEDRPTIDGLQVRSYYSGYIAEAYKTPVENPTAKFELKMESTVSLLDKIFADQPAQYAKRDGTPQKYWDDSERLIKGILRKPDPKAVVDTTLSDIDTTQLHYVKVPENHVVIDFDLIDETGKKSLDLNKAATKNWPATYAEVSKSGSGIHLHYIYSGDTSELAPIFSNGIEVKVYRDNSGLRRKLTLCNDVSVATIGSGLPLKEKKMLTQSVMQTEKSLKELVRNNLLKKYHAGTKPSIDFIEKILSDAYESGVEYDLSDLQPSVFAFANGSSNHSIYCLRAVKRMKFVGNKESAEIAPVKEPEPADSRIVYFDVEVFPNLFVICWKYEGSPTVVRMINPSAAEVELLFNYKLVGFYNRKYDNHILWARFMNYPNQKLFELSKRLVEDKTNSTGFGTAYSLSYADVYEYSSRKQSLKKWEIELGLDHIEIGIPWDKPVPPELVDKVVEYCVNDVIATEAVADHIKQDFVARQILADLSGLTINDTTQKHTSRIIFGNKRDPHQDFVYTELEKEFPGYKFDQYSKDEKSTYRGDVVGEGGYVYSEPGLYENVELLDVVSMHPTSIYLLNLFGVHTEKFWELVRARVAIKRAAESFKYGHFEKAEEYLVEARKMFDGKLIPHLKDIEGASGLERALKIVINIVYGLTSATFENSFRDPRNKDNIVAKRGALFMIDLKNAVQEQGFSVAHIKTDSIKIPNASKEIIDFVKEFGKKYGYDFEHEKTYHKMCLVNDAVYIANYTNEDGDNEWVAVGAQFQHPYVFKTLFSGEPVSFDDLCETKAATKGAIYLVDEEIMEKRNQVIAAKKDEVKAKIKVKAKKDKTPQELKDDKKALDELDPNPELTEEELGKFQFIGRVGRFVPVTKESGGRLLMRVQDNMPFAVTGTKGTYWAEAIVVQKRNEIDMSHFDVASAHKPGGFVVDMTYFEKLSDAAKDHLDKFGGGYSELVSV
jgi:hypothetical protein